MVNGKRGKAGALTAGQSKFPNHQSPATNHQSRLPVIRRQRLVALLEQVLPRRRADFAATDEDMLRLRRELERIARPDDDIRILARLQRPDSIGDAEHL